MTESELRLRRLKGLAMSESADSVGGNAPRFRCCCVWTDQRCPNEVTQEDGLCDWCGDRRTEQLRQNPKAMIAPNGDYLGLGGAGEAHVDPDRRPDACWMTNSGRTIVRAGS